jgi:hypothetical protein
MEDPGWGAGSSAGSVHRRESEWGGRVGSSWAVAKRESPREGNEKAVNAK